MKNRSQQPAVRGNVTIRTLGSVVYGVMLRHDHGACPLRWLRRENRYEARAVIVRWAAAYPRNMEGAVLAADVNFPVRSPLAVCRQNKNP